VKKYVTKLLTRKEPGALPFTRNLGLNLSGLNNNRLLINRIRYWIGNGLLNRIGNGLWDRISVSSTISISVIGVSEAKAKTYAKTKTS
jgi:hypothetical protein